MVADGEDSETGNTQESSEEERGEEGLVEVVVVEAGDRLLLPPENSLTTNWTVTCKCPVQYQVVLWREE